MVTDEGAGMRCNCCCHAAVTTVASQHASKVPPSLLLELLKFGTGRQMFVANRDNSPSLCLSLSFIDT